MRPRCAIAACLLLVAGCIPRFTDTAIKFDPIWGPTPNVQPAPVVDPKITTHELRILVLVDTAGKPMSSKMTAILGSKNLRDFVNEHCLQEKSGGKDVPAFRRADGTKNPDGSWVGGFEGPWLEMANKYPPTELPWIILVNGSEGTGQKPPEDWTKFGDLLNKYAGLE